MSSKRTRDHIDLDLTPLIDVVFLLLIFFLVSTVYKNEELALMLKLPVVESGKGKNPETKITSIEITNDAFAIDGKKLSENELDNAIAQLSKDRSITVRADQNAYYKRIVTVLDLIQKYQLENVSLITEKK
jgi:biopolymer transport protein ExbD